MKDRLIYIELKSGYSDNGPAWIGIAGASSLTAPAVYISRVLAPLHQRQGV